MPRIVYIGNTCVRLFCTDQPKEQREAKLSVMKEILEHKCKQVPEYRETLINSKSNKLVEATPGDYFWSSELNKEDMLNTNTKYWFGQNKMGLLLTVICSTLQDSSKI